MSNPIEQMARKMISAIRGDTEFQSIEYLAQKRELLINGSIEIPVAEVLNAIPIAILLDVRNIWSIKDLASTEENHERNRNCTTTDKN